MSKEGNECVSLLPLWGLLETPRQFALGLGEVVVSRLVGNNLFHCEPPPGAGTSPPSDNIPHVILQIRPVGRGVN